MSCDKIQDLLSPYMDGELDSSGRAEVDSHLDTCPNCADLLARLRTAMNAFAAFPEVEPAVGLSLKLEAIPVRSRRFRLRFDVLLRPAFQPVLAAAAGFLLLAGIYLVSPDKGLINRTISRQFHRSLGSVEKIYVQAGSLTDRLGEYANTIFASAKSINPIGRGKD
jgi:anti-sigma factor RsiW